MRGNIHRFNYVFMSTNKKVTPIKAYIFSQENRRKTTIDKQRTAVKYSKFAHIQWNNFGMCQTKKCNINIGNQFISILSNYRAKCVSEHERNINTLYNDKT